MPQNQHVLQRFSPQVEVAVLQANVFVGQLAAELVDLERQRRAGVQHLNLLRDQFNESRRNVRPFLPDQTGAHGPGDRHAELLAKLHCDWEYVWVVGFKHDLREAVAVLQVHENLVVVRPGGQNPAVERDGVPDVRFA